MSAENQTPPPGVTPQDSGIAADRIDGGSNIDTLISDFGDDTLRGGDSTDIYVINNVSNHRNVNIIDMGENLLAIEGGNNMMHLVIKQNEVRLDGEPLKLVKTSPDGHKTFEYKQGNLTLQITPDDEVNKKANGQQTKAEATTNPLLQKLAGVSLENKLAALNDLHDQLRQLQTLAQKTGLNQDADRN